MVRFLGWILLMGLLLPLGSPAQEAIRFTLSPEPVALALPVFVPLDFQSETAEEGSVLLYEVTRRGEREIPCQVVTTPLSGIWFLAEPMGEKRTFEVRTRGIADQMVPPGAPPATGIPPVGGAGSTIGPAQAPSTGRGGVSLDITEQAITLLKRGSPVLSYNHAEVWPPEGVDPLFKRSGFIHPLWSPGGEVLTRIQPPDHYHHYGIWNPWTKTLVDGREIDFWNLYKGQGTVQYGGCLETVVGPLYAGFKVLQEHLWFGERNRAKTAMQEVWEVRVWNTPDEKVTLVDFISILHTPLREGILLDAYRYGGGLGFRATEKWQKENCSVLTSEGKRREDADGTAARWCITEGESAVPQGRSGILFMSHPANRSHPEPMRVWPPDSNGGRGDLFFEFCPIRHTPWKLEPRKSYTLRYRMVIFDGTLSPGEAENYWSAFAAPPRVIGVE